MSTEDKNKIIPFKPHGEEKIDYGVENPENYWFWSLLINKSSGENPPKKGKEKTKHFCEKNTKH